MAHFAYCGHVYYGQRIIKGAITFTGPRLQWPIYAGVRRQKAEQCCRLVGHDGRAALNHSTYVGTESRGEWPARD